MSEAANDSEQDAFMALLTLEYPPADAAGTAEQALAKRIATFKARAALAGSVLHETTDDGGRPLLVLSRWSMTKAFTIDELDALDRVLALMGQPA